jgi:hypothetical protein
VATTSRRKNWAAGDCTCEAINKSAYRYVHLPACPAARDLRDLPQKKVDPHADKLFDFEQHTAPANPAPFGLFSATGSVIKPKRKKHRAPRRVPKMPDYRFLLQFYFTRPINITLWKCIKAPPGWVKCPTSKAKQDTYRGVRFICKDFKYALSVEEIQMLHSKLLLSLEI